MFAVFIGWSKLAVVDMETIQYRRAIADYIRAAAQPPDKFSHQPRVYEIARRLGEDKTYDDDVLYAAALLHDVGVFAGHRPEDLAQLAVWDHVAYAIQIVPQLLETFCFPKSKIPRVLETIRTHLPKAQPTSTEGALLHDADILEQLGAIGILRMVSKVGRDTRYPTTREALDMLQRNAQELPPLLCLPAARRLAEPRLAAMTAFFEAANAELAAE